MYAWQIAETREPSKLHDDPLRSHRTGTGTR
jgi:hypothetical protein